MRLGHIGLTCADLDRSEKFYSELFGFKTFFRIRRKTPWLAAQVGYDDADIEFCHMRGADGLHLELLKYWRPHTESTLFDGTYYPGNVHINFWVDDAALVAKMAAHWWRNNPEIAGLSRFATQPLNIEATTITDGPQEGGKGFYMRDPDGHTIEVWQPPPGSKFGKEAVLSLEMSDIIDRIEAARGKQNTNWMNLIRLAYRTAPDEAREIFRKIEAQDEAILKLAKSSADAT